MNLNCRKCEQLMEEGYVIDSLAYQSKSETWIEGKKPKSIWAGLTKNNKKQFEVETYRCINCGYLESYAKVEK